MANSVTRKRIETVSLLEYASINRDEGFFSDITIVAGKQTIAANRLVLSCYSRYFEGMFKSKMKEGYQSVIEIQAVDGQTTKALIDFIYTGSVTINNENVMLLLSGADYFQAQEVKQFCFEFLRTNISPDNALEILKAATLYMNDALKDEVEQYINANFEEVVKTEDFKALSKENLGFWILHLGKKKVDTALIYKAILSWVRHKEDRKTNFADLFKMLDLDLMSLDFFEEFILEEDLVTSSFDCQRLSLKAFRRLVERQKLKLHETKLLCLGGSVGDLVTCVYDMLYERGVDYPDLPKHLFQHCSMKLNNYIYCLGGSIDHEGKFVASTRECWRLNLNEEKSIWKPVAPMKQRRSFMAGTVYNETIVVTGGWDEKPTRLDSSEFYQPQSNKWALLPSMNQPRSLLALVSANGNLYALGGCGEKNSVLSCVERLSDLTATSWKNITPMHTARELFAAVNCNGKIYAIGGKTNGKTITKSVETYDESTKQWKYVNDMNFERSNHTACSMQSKIYVVGGSDEQDEPVLEIECYNPINDTWNIVATLKEKWSDHSMIAV